MLKGVGIGAGYFSQFHYEAWSRMDGVDLVAICDLNVEKARGLAEHYGVPGVYSSVENMLEKERPDFIDIITPPETHLDLVRLAAARRINIICQKPLAPSLEEAELLVHTAEQAGVRLMVHENFRFQPWYRKIKQLLETKRIGEKVHHLHFRMRTGDGWPEDAYLGRQPYFRTMPRLLIYETGIHFIDTFRFLLGEVDKVFARLQKLNPEIAGEDAALVWFDFTNGAHAVYDANRYNESQAEDPRYTFGELLLDTDAGSLRLYPDGRLGWQALGKKEIKIDYSHQRINFGADCVYFTQQHFIHSLRHNLPFETYGRDYLKNLQIQEAIYRSDRLGQPVVLG